MPLRRAQLGQVREPLALFGWARTIAVRQALRMARARHAQRQPPVELADVPAPGDPELAHDIRDVLQRLSPEHRAVLVLRELEGLDERTMGDLLDVPPGTVKSRISRARDRFRKAWPS